jgi:hypothetical protein
MKAPCSCSFKATIAEGAASRKRLFHAEVDERNTAPVTVIAYLRDRFVHLQGHSAYEKIERSGAHDNNPLLRLERKR